MKTDMTALGVQLSNLQSQITRLEVSLPLTYVTRIELAERLKTVTDECDRRDKSNQEDSQRIEATIQKLLFAIFGALITGGLALLSEVFRLLGHSQ
jgi:hypothetical protein